MPTKVTPFRLSDTDLEYLDSIVGMRNLKSRSDALRYAIRLASSQCLSALADEKARGDEGFPEWIGGLTYSQTKRAYEEHFDKQVSGMLTIGDMVSSLEGAMGSDEARDYVESFV